MLRIDLFGTLRVHAQGGCIGPEGFPGAKPKQLLEILAAARGRGVSKEVLAGHLWGDEPPRKYLATLETYVSVLRRTLEADVPARQSLIVTERGGYHVESDKVEIDLDRFDALLVAAEGARPAAALQCLTDALALVRGPVLEDEPYAEWADQLRTVYRPRHVNALVSAGQLCLLSGDAHSALARAEEAISLNPLSETAYQVQMTAAYALWRQDDALAAFDRCRRLLGEELGVDPLDKTVELHLSILRHEDLASLLPRFVAEPRNAVPAQRSAAPTPPTTLLGRDHELAQIQQAVARAADGRFTVVLVTGETGIGKTSIVEAVMAATSLRSGSNRCSDLEQGLPYLALSLALRSMSAEMADGLPLLDELLVRAEQHEPFDEFARLRVMEQLATSISSTAPFLLVLDDVQWADAETLRTINYLHRRCPQAPVAVLLTCERAEVRGAAVRSLLVDLRVDLDTLPAGALQDDDLHALTGGHPLYVAAWHDARARGLGEPFPPELSEQVLIRCWDLGPQPYQLLSVACALEPPITVAVLATLVETSPSEVAEQLDHLVEQRFLDASEEGFRFRSPVVQRILLDTLSPTRRMLLRQKAAAAVASPQRRTTDVMVQLPGNRDRRRATDLPRVPHSPSSDEAEDRPLLALR